MTEDRTPMIADDMLRGPDWSTFRTGIIRKLVTYEGYAMGPKKEYTGNDDWYPYTLSVRKDEQGKGMVSTLIHPMLQFYDLVHRMTYLETNDESNVGPYQHYGYDLMEVGKVPKSNVTHYPMVRKPSE